MHPVRSPWGEQTAGSQRQFERGRATGLKPEPSRTPEPAKNAAPGADKPKLDRLNQD